MRQQQGESTDTYFSMAEKTALRHDLSELYKVKFTMHGLDKHIKEKVLSKEAKHFKN